jgi:hypothetical protein
MTIHFFFIIFLSHQYVETINDELNQKMRRQHDDSQLMPRQTRYPACSIHVHLNLDHATLEFDSIKVCADAAYTEKPDRAHIAQLGQLDRSDVVCEILLKQAYHAWGEIIPRKRAVCRKAQVSEQDQVPIRIGAPGTHSVRQCLIDSCDDRAVGALESRRAAIVRPCESACLATAPSMLELDRRCSAAQLELEGVASIRYQAAREAMRGDIKTIGLFMDDEVLLAGTHVATRN